MYVWSEVKVDEEGDLPWSIQWMGLGQRNICFTFIHVTTVVVSLTNIRCYEPYVHS